MARMRVAFQGEQGAYSEEAGHDYLPGAEMVPHETFDDVFTSVASGICKAGLIPIENSLAGSIHQNYDLLLGNNLFIVGEYFFRIRHCLIGFPDVNRSEIKRVISHPQALGQCNAYLKDLRIKPEAVYDTAGSVKILKSSGDRTCGAIASKRAAEIYGMSIIQEGIEDDPENYTRFLKICPNKITPSTEAKTSIVFTLKNEPGALFNAIRVFAEKDIDMTKIESRPLVGKIWEYYFYVDLIGASDRTPVQEALDQLAENALMLRVLGSYPRFKS
jgi:prephenate dehydratase